MEMIEKLSLAGIVPVIKVEDAADAVPLCKALSDGGLPVAEITFRSDAAEEASAAFMPSCRRDSGRRHRAYEGSGGPRRECRRDLHCVSRAES